MTERDDQESDMTRPAVRLSMVGWWLLVLALILYGVLFIYSTGYISDDYPVRTTWMRHVLWCALGVFVAVGISSFNLRGLGMRWFTWCGYFLSLAGLALVLVAGVRVGGANRWLAFGPVTLQPAEFAKIFTLLAVCRMLCPEERQPRLRRWAGCLWIPVVAGVPMALIVKEPSLGNAFAILPCVFAVVCIRLLWRHLWSLLLIVLCGALVFGGVSLFQMREAAENAPVADSVAAKSPMAGNGGGFFRGYHQKRLASFLTASGSWNERQSMMTMAGGGLTGKGYLNGSMKSLGYLPRTVAPTDFIFSVIGEEMGFLFGTLPVLCLYGCLLWLGLHWSGAAYDALSCLSGVAMLTLLGVHVLINVGMTVRLFPIVGLPLPLLSYGGSFTMATFIALGIVLGIGRRNHCGLGEKRLSGVVADSVFGIKLFQLCKLTVTVTDSPSRQSTVKDDA